MAFPNPFHGAMGPNFRGPFPNPRMNEPPFDFRGFGAGFDDHLRRLAFYREAEIRARLEFRDGIEPLPPGLDINGGMFLGRDRQRDRDMEMRDMMMREERDLGRDRDRRRNDYDRDRGRGLDWDQDRDGNRSERHRDRTANRDRSPVHSTPGGSDSEARTSNYEAIDNEFFPLGMAENAERSNSSLSEMFRSRESDVRGDTARSMDDKGGDKWVSNQPSRTIILRGLHLDIDEKLIAAELMLLGLAVKDIRLIKRSSGVSRGFAFVEFHNVADAQRWMEHTQGTFVLLNQYRASMAYSATRDRGGNTRDNLQRNDWVCCKCLSHNFKRRDFCYNCNLARKESEKGRTYDGLDEIGTNPCNTLILRGLDALTTEEALVTALTQAFAPSQLVPIKNIVVVRDELGTSRGFGFVEFHSVAASTLVLDNLKLLHPPLEVDGKQLLINYAKNTFNTTMAYIQQKSQAQQQLYDYTQYYGQGAATYGHTGAAGISGENSTNSAAAVAQAAIQQAQAVKHFQNKIRNKAPSPTSHETVTVNGVEYPVYPPPDTSSYQYEETSGYYYDPLTRLYYDANSQYYYNSTSGQYMYWDAVKSTYLPAPDPAEANTQDAQASHNNKEGKEEKKDKEKVKIAKKIAKDMEKWAKSMNAQKDAQKEVVKKTFESAGGSRQESATADAGFAMLQKVKEDISLMPPPPKPDKSAAAGKPGLVASYGGDSDSGEEEDQSLPVDESKLVDWGKLACLLCKRQFQSKDILSKHTQVSELHKQNLEALIKCRGTSTTEKIEYRDRAKERREKYGAPEPPEPLKRKEKHFESAGPDMYEEPTKLGIGGDNIGSKLLQKMGWSEGQGLGRSNQGRVDPIKAQQRNQMAGLGARGAKVVADVGDDYRVALKKTMFARYSEVD